MLARRVLAFLVASVWCRFKKNMAMLETKKRIMYL